MGFLQFKEQYKYNYNQFKLNLFLLIGNNSYQLNGLKYSYFINPTHVLIHSSSYVINGCY